MQKLDTICAGLRRNARKVREGIADLPGLKLRKTPDQEGDIGVTVFADHGTRKRRNRFVGALHAEGIAANGPGGSAILPTIERIEKKLTIHPDWPSFTNPEGKAIQYGKNCCPRTTKILSRYGGVIMDPNFTDADTKDIVQAFRKVYLAMNKA